MGPAGLGESGRPGPGAILGGPFAQVQAHPSEGVLVALLPDLSRPACFSFGIRPNFSGILCSPSSFGFAAQ